MVDRGPRRVSADEAQRGSVQFQLHGNGWRFPAGHQIRLELAQDDDPYLKRSDVPSSSTVSRFQLQLPLRETTFGTKPSGAGGRAFAPTARMLAPRLASDSSTEPRFRIAWRGASFGSPLRAFQVQVQTTGPPRRRGHAARSWRTLSGLGATTRTSAMFRGRPGETYEFRVRARNTAGLASRYSSASTVVPLDELGAGARYRGSWHRQRSRGAWRGRVITCTARRCRVELRYRGGTLYLVGRTGPRGGLARVTLDGRSRTVSFYSRRVGQRQVVFSSRKTVRVHRLGVAVLHRKRRGGRGFEVAVDAFGLANLR
jgi:hypothetical protein